MSSRTLVVPDGFSFNKRGVVSFDHVLQFFDTSLTDGELVIDLTRCESSNYQALALLLQYAWYLTTRGCSVTFKYALASSGSSKMLRKMNALDWRSVLVTEGRDFGSGPGRQTYALRRRADVQNTINQARRVIQNYAIGFPDYLSYIVSELLYNSTEHGRRSAEIDTFKVAVPAIFQFGYYPGLNRISFLFSDLGIGVKQHLEQTYEPFRSDHEAIVYALRPNVSGTFRQQSEAYAMTNNAGMGLNYSSLMMKRLRGDMYIASGMGLVHVSPEDVTSRRLQFPWPGTFVLVNVNLAGNEGVTLEELMAEVENNARRELSRYDEAQQSQTYSVSIALIFGQYAEDKEAAISFRDQYLLPAVAKGHRLELDFKDVKTAPHSFLNALLASPAQRLGIRAYQKIKVINAPGFIHEIINTVIEHNVPPM